MDTFSLFNGAAGQAALDELRIGDRVGPNSMFVHCVHGFHGSGQISLVAKLGEFMNQGCRWVGQSAGRRMIGNRAKGFDREAGGFMHGFSPEKPLFMA